MAGTACLSVLHGILSPSGLSLASVYVVSEQAEGTGPKAQGLCSFQAPKDKTFFS